MTRRRKIALWTLGGVAAGGALLTIGAAVFSSRMSFNLTLEKARERFDDTGAAMPEVYLHQGDGFETRVVIAGNRSRPGIVFIHGSPGSWGDYVGYLADPSLLEDFCLVSVDRPGFGNSRSGSAIPSLAEQARRIQEAVASSRAPLPAIWVGHSLGGPVAARVAADHSESVSGLLLLAATLDPELEEPFWFNRLAALPPVRWGLSSEWRNSNDEIMPHGKELRLLEPLLGGITAPVIVLHGAADSLVPVGHAAFAQEAFEAAMVDVRILDGADHFIPWTHKAQVVECIRDLAKRSGTDRRHR